MTAKAARAVSKAAIEKNVHVQMYDEWKVLCEPQWEDEDLHWYCNRLGMEYRVIDPSEMEDIRPLKMSGIERESKERLQAFGRYLTEQAPGLVDAFLSNDMLLEIVGYGQNKGSALHWLSQHIGVPREGTVAVGDEANDIPMLKAAHIGVAMINGTPETRAAADVISERDNNHCGVAEVIEKYILSVQHG